MCEVLPVRANEAPPVLAEVVGFEAGRVVLMPFGGLQGIGVGSRVVALGNEAEIGVGQELLGRVIDGFGAPLDARPVPVVARRWPLAAPAPSPMARPRVRTLLETGVRAIPARWARGGGQRAGTFAGSGVGKSSWRGTARRWTRPGGNVNGWTGERARAVRESGVE